MLHTKRKISNSLQCQEDKMFNVSYIANTEIDKETYPIFASLFQFATFTSAETAFNSCQQDRRIKPVIIANIRSSILWFNIRDVAVKRQCLFSQNSITKRNLPACLMLNVSGSNDQVIMCSKNFMMHWLHRMQL
jgi:hypothetical protein